MQSFHNLDFANEFDTIVVMLIKSLHMLNSNDLLGNKTLSLEHLAVAAFANLFYDRVVF